MCKSCGMYVKQVEEKKDEGLYDAHYFDSYPYSKSFGLMQSYFKQKIEAIKEGTGMNNPRILDVGCGWGDFLSVVKGEGLPYFGIDVSPIAVKKLKEKNINCDVSTIEMYAKTHKNEFDAIVSFQTIEHIKNPILYLNSAYTLLRPGGIILLTTPNNDSPLRYLLRGKWSVYNTDSHYSFFTKQTLRKTIEKTTFNDIKIRIDPPRFFTPRYIFSRLSFDLPSILHPLGRALPSGRRPLSSHFPLPTDFLGDLEATAFRPR